MTATAAPDSTSASLPRLAISEDGRCLVTVDGRTFFWLGDTAWSLFTHSSKEEREDQPSVDLYFQTRKRQEFTVIQTHLLTNPTRGPIDAPNLYGHEPFINGDFTRPRVVPGPDNDYWDYADYLIRRAREYGLYMAIVAVWGNSLGEDDSHPLVADPKVAYAYGWFLGDRYRDASHIIWLLGGDTFGPRNDRRRLTPARLRMTRALAEGIADGIAGVRNFDGKADYSKVLMSYHPPGGGQSSSKYFHEEPWLDFNMIQTTTRFRFFNYKTVLADYLKEPPKPVLDGEVAYEYSFPLNRKERERFPGRRITPWYVRRGAYWNVFSGGFGHTYGHRSFIGWVRTGEPPLRWGADRPWFEVLEAEGATQMKWLRRLAESRPMEGRVPDQLVILDEQEDGDDYACALRDREGRYLMVYVPTGKPVRIRMSAVRGDRAIVWWFNPRTGEARRAGEYPTPDPVTFRAPSNGPGEDWVLVLDAASEKYPPPGVAVR